MAIKEHLKRAQGYRMEACGLWCHHLLVFKKRWVSIKAVRERLRCLDRSVAGYVMIHASGLYKQLSRENNLPHKELF